MPEGVTARVAVTGANGHLGRAVLARLAAAGGPALALSSSGGGGQQRFHLEEPPAEDLLADVGVVVHTAWDLAARAPEQARAVNVAGSRRLVEAAAARGARTVFVSSLAAYEGTLSAYGASKREVEGIVAGAGGVSVRPGLIFGPAVGGMFAMLREQVTHRRIVPVLRSPGRL